MRSAFLFACIAPASAFVATAPLRAPVQARSPAAVQMAAAADDFVPDLQRRTIMNLILLGGAGVPVLWLAGGFIYYLVPRAAAAAAAASSPRTRLATTCSCRSGRPSTPSPPAAWCRVSRATRTT